MDAATYAAAIKGIWGPFMRDGRSSFPVYRELGVRLYEEDLHWDTIAPTRPRHPADPSDSAYVWPSEVLRAVHEANRYGMQVALQIIGAPRWANGNKPPKWATFSPRAY